jgi:hypothetical protein
LLLGNCELLLQLLDLVLKLKDLLFGSFGALPPGVAAEADIVDADLESLQFAVAPLRLGLPGSATLREFGDEDARRRAERASRQGVSGRSRLGGGSAGVVHVSPSPFGSPK